MALHTSPFETLTRKIRKNSFPYLLIAPMAVAMAVLILYPIGRVIWMSFHDYYLARPGSNPFIGLDNYIEVVTAFEFLGSVKVTLAYLLVTVPVRYLLALGIALLINRAFFGSPVVRSFLIVPWALPAVVASLIWFWLFGQENGLINNLLLRLGVIQTALGFLSDMDLALVSTMVVNIWKGTPFIAIMLLAGLQSIPNELYEAAKLDGASAWQILLNITLPLIKPVTNFALLLLVIWTMRDFDLVYAMTSGGPARATELFTIFLYHTAFQGLRFGEASAGGVLLLIFSMIFTVFFLKLTRGEESVW